MAGTVKTYVSITGFNVDVGSTYELSMKMSVSRSSNTHDVTVTSLSTSTMTLYGVTYHEMSININDYLALPGQITMGPLTATNGGPISYSDSNIRDFNTIIGLDGFHFNNQNFFSWETSTTPFTSLDVTSSNAFLYLSFNYIILEVNWCGPPMHYQLIAANTCYDICPVRYFARDYPY
jgi:hypothetical protein